MNFEPGDIAACYGTDWTSRWISLATASLSAPAALIMGPSHVAIFCEHQSQTLWVESTTMCISPCEILQKRISGAQAHRAEDRIQDYVSTGGQVDIYRLTPINRFTKDEADTLARILIQHIVTAEIIYDLHGAILSGTRLFQWSKLFPYADLNELFCSELVAAITMRLNRMNHANPSRYNPGRLLRTLVSTGKYQRVASFNERSTSYAPLSLRRTGGQSCR